MESIFGRFFTVGRNAGTGLGLAIARELTELNRGSPALTSRDTPVEFRFRFPA